MKSLWRLSTTCCLVIILPLLYLSEGADREEHKQQHSEHKKPHRYKHPKSIANKPWKHFHKKLNNKAKKSEIDEELELEEEVYLRQVSLDLEFAEKLRDYIGAENFGEELPTIALEIPTKTRVVSTRLKSNARNLLSSRYQAEASISKVRKNISSDILNSTAILSSENSSDSSFRLTAVKNEEGGIEAKGMLLADNSAYEVKIEMGLESNTSLDVPEMQVRELKKKEIEAAISGCGISHAEEAAAAVFEQSRSKASAEVVETLKVVELATEADYEYFLAEGESEVSANAAIIAIINDVDAIYRKQLSTKIVIVYQHVWTTEDDPYDGTAPGTVLSQLGSVWHKDFTHIKRNLLHLFTGRDMDGSVVGYAWISSACYSTNAVSQRLWSHAIMVPLVAHEIGHNFGSSHDDCSGGEQWIMCPRLKSTLKEFSPDSVSRMTSRTVNCLPEEESAPSIITEPSDTTVTEGDDATFEVEATGGNLTYQWYKNYVLIDGATSSTYTLEKVDLLDEGLEFYVVVSNSTGTVTSDFAKLSVSQLLAPVITQHPKNARAEVGGSATFSVKVSGTSPFEYKWYRNNTLIEGEDDSLLTLSGLSLGSSGDSVHVVVSNRAGERDSKKAFISMIKPKPIKVSYFVASDGTSDEYVHLRWKSVEHAEKYRVYRSTVLGEVGEILSENLEATSYTDQTVSSSKKYFYSVQAYNRDKVGEISSQDAGWRRVNKFEIDTDNDGLSDGRENELGTKPDEFDSDRDGVGDGDELSHGSNPLDKGSYQTVLGTRLCSDWNGFLNMFNILEHVNLGDNPVDIKTEVISLEGGSVDSHFLTVDSGGQQDVLVHDLNGWDRGQVGRVCTSHNGSEGELDGRMIYYKPSSNRTGEEFEFAFALPFTSYQKGAQFVPFNTYQPSLNPEDQDNLVANWIQVANQSDTFQKGQLLFYDMDGEALGVEDVVVAPGSRVDSSGHQFGPWKVGLVEWVPEDSNALFQVSNLRYVYDNPGSTNSFDTAFPVPASVGNGELLSVALDTQGATSVLEVANALAEFVNAKITITSESGEVLHEFFLELSPKSSRHLIMDEILPNSMGVAFVEGDKLGSLVVTGMHYGRESDLGIKYMYGLSAKQALGNKLRSSYNTFLNQNCSMRLVNTSSSNVSASVSISRSDGTKLLDSQLVEVPARGLLSYDCGIDEANNYGVVSLETGSANSLLGTVLRLGEADTYRFVTPLR